MKSNTNFLTSIEETTYDIMREKMYDAIKNSSPDRPIAELYEELKDIYWKYFRLNERLKDQYNFDMDFASDIRLVPADRKKYYQ